MQSFREFILSVNVREEKTVDLQYVTDVYFPTCLFCALIK